MHIKVNDQVSHLLSTEAFFIHIEKLFLSLLKKEEIQNPIVGTTLQELHNLERGREGNNIKAALNSTIRQSHLA